MEPVGAEDIERFALFQAFPSEIPPTTHRKIGEICEDFEKAPPSPTSVVLAGNRQQPLSKLHPSGTRLNLQEEDHQKQKAKALVETH